MTFERKIVVGLEDIRAITLECSNQSCRKRIIYSPHRQFSIPEACTCGQRWFGEPKNAGEYQVLINSLVLCRKRAKENPESEGAKVLLEFDENP